MENGFDFLDHEEALNDTEIYFTINLNATEYLDDTLDSQSSASNNGSIHDESFGDCRIMHTVLESWLVQSIRNSPNRRLTWDEVLTLYCNDTSALLSSWYMSKGPDGLFHCFTTYLPGSKIICHNYINCTTTISHSTPPTTRSSNTDYDEYDNFIVTHDIETDEFDTHTAENPSDILSTPIIDLVDLGKKFERLRSTENILPPNENILPKDSNSRSFGSVITFQSYMDTNSIDFLSIQSDNDIDDETVVDYRDSDMNEHNIEPALIAANDQYCDYEEESVCDESTASLSPTESPDYKNYSIKELVMFPETVRWYYNHDYHWKKHLTTWLLSMLRESSSIKLWYNFVAMEFMNTFGISSIPNLLTWIDNELPDFTIAECTHDGELYLYQTSTHTHLQTVWDAIENYDINEE